VPFAPHSRFETFGFQVCIPEDPFNSAPIRITIPQVEEEILRKREETGPERRGTPGAANIPDSPRNEPDFLPAFRAIRMVARGYFEDEIKAVPRADGFIVKRRNRPGRDDRPSRPGFHLKPVGFLAPPYAESAVRFHGQLR